MRWNSDGKLGHDHSMNGEDESDDVSSGDVSASVTDVFPIRSNRVTTMGSLGEVV